MIANNNTPRPTNVIELPRFVFSSLSRVHPDAIDRELTPLVEQIARSIDAENGYVFEMPADGAGHQVICQWSEPGLSGHQALDLQLCPYLLGRVAKGETVSLARVPDGLPVEATEDVEELGRRRIQSLLLVPVVVEDRIYGVGAHSTRKRGEWAGEVPAAFRFTTEILAAAIHHRQVQRELSRAKADLARLSQRLETQTRVFREDILTVHDFDDMVGSSPAFRSALAAVREVAPTDTTALLLGETGTGKELFARAIHERSPRRQRPFICVNCAALPATLIESELFGHERGAFTGAIAARQGRFELADRGTIFLDEVGDLPLELQPKLLRVLQEREFERVGSSQRRRADVRVIAATHQDLQTAVAEGRFRADLYYRLSVFPITLPPLRERPEDVPQLVWFLINQRQRRLHCRITDIPKATMDALQSYHWPGNVRELENIIERAMIRSSNGTLHIDESLMAKSRPPVIAEAGSTLEALERAHIEATLRLCNGRINGTGNAAERLGLHPNTLRFRMKKLGIVRKRHEDSERPAEGLIAERAS
jgi:transcriptional regulator with GAF, ATPase, and Fis domain